MMNKWKVQQTLPTAIARTPSTSFQILRVIILAGQSDAPFSATALIVLLSLLSLCVWVGVSHSVTHFFSVMTASMDTTSQELLNPCEISIVSSTASPRTFDSPSYSSSTQTKRIHHQYSK